MNKHVVNGEQGCRGLIFSCDKDDLRSVVSIGVYRWVCNISQFLFFHFREGVLTSKKEIEVVELSLEYLLRPDT